MSAIWQAAAVLPTASGTPDSDAFQVFNITSGALQGANNNQIQVHQQNTIINGTGVDVLVDLIFEKNRKTAQGTALDVSPSSDQFSRIQVPRNNLLILPAGLHVVAARIGSAAGTSLNWHVANGLHPAVRVRKIADGLIIPTLDPYKLTRAGLVTWATAEDRVDFDNFVLCNNRGGQSNIRLFTRRDPKYNGDPTVTGQGSQYFIPQRSIWEGAPGGYEAYSTTVTFVDETTLIAWN